MSNKSIKTLREAITLCGLKDGMTVSFHHHLRNGDYVLNMVMNEIAAMNIKGLTVNASSLFDTHLPLIEHAKNHVVRTIQTDYMSGVVGRCISEGVMEEPVEFRTHGGRPSAIELGYTPIDVAFIAAPASDSMGNCTGKYGKSACGSLGYAFPDAMNAKKVIVITDNLVPYPLPGWSIPETYVDYVVEVDAIGDPSGIVSGTTRITRDPIGLIMAADAARVIQHSGLLKDGFSFQTGAGGASLAAAKFLKDIMLKEKIKGSFGLGGITGYMVEMLNAGCFDALLDVQCFDLEAIESIRSNPRHREISATHYASPSARSAVVDSLDVVILGATEIDTEFNVNVHTDSNGYIMGGSGGHSDTAAGAKLSMIIAPLSRARLPIVTDRVTCISTPGKDIDVVVTQKGIAVNPGNKELSDRLIQAGLPIVDIRELKEIAERTTGVPSKLEKGERTVAKVIYRDGTLLDTIYNVSNTP
ncbi:MAG: citrate lyase subunit alpha [Clostridiaceae bacterium]